MALNDQYIIEFIRHKNIMKVSAIDPISCKEVSIQAPANTPKTLMVNIVIKKLKIAIKTINS